MNLKNIFMTFLLCSLIGCVEKKSEKTESKEVETPIETKSKAATIPEQTAKLKASKVEVDDVKLADMRAIMEGLTKEIGGVEELFKVISAEIQTIDRERPVDTIVREARQKGFMILCYTQGSDEITASTDPIYLGKSAKSIKTADGKVVRDLAIEELRKGDRKEAIFTYVAEPEKGAPIVNGKKVAHGRLVVAKGRKAFKKFHSAKKFLCTIGSDAHIEQ